MGWFAIACIVGFAIYWWRDALREHVRQQWPELAAVLALLAAVWLICDALGSYEARTLLHVWFPSTIQLLDRLPGSLESGNLARILFGAILGLGLGFAYATDHGIGAGPRRNLRSDILWIGLGLAVLATIAPHVDSWLSRVSNFKSIGIEIQLRNLVSNSASTQKLIAPDPRENYLEETILQDLLKYSYTKTYDGLIKRYDEHIENDLDFFNAALIPAVEFDRQQLQRLSCQRSRLDRLKQALEGTFIAIARCLTNAIDKKWSIESARDAVRPVIDLAYDITLADAAGKSDREARERFPGATEYLLRKISTYIGPSAPDEGCAVDKASQFPAYEDYKNFPHLFVAIASLALFTRNSELASKALRDADHRQRLSDANDQYVHEYASPYLQYRILWFTNEPALRYLPYLNSDRERARTDQDLIENRLSRCSGDSCEKLKELRRRARNEELKAMNAIAYGISQDLAAGLNPAESLQPIAKNHAEELSRAIDRGDVERVADVDEGDFNKYTWLDTVAFVRLVDEARKSKPDLEKIRKSEADFARALAFFVDKLGEVHKNEEELDAPSLSRSLPLGRGKVRIRNYVQVAGAHRALAHGVLDVLGE